MESVIFQWVLKWMDTTSLFLTLLRTKTVLHTMVREQKLKQKKSYIFTEKIFAIKQEVIAHSQA